MSDKYVFLDRDGVINEDGQFVTEHGYITRWEDFRFLPGVLEALRRLTEAGYGIVIISNQKCVGKGIMSEEELRVLTDKMLEAVKEHGGEIKKVYYCLHVDEDKCDCRKPETGMFRKAVEELGIRAIKGKFYVGDSERDIQAGKKMGLETIFVLSGKYSREDAEKWAYRPDHMRSDLLDAVDLILGS